MENLTIFIGAYKKFEQVVFDKSYAIIVGNHDIEGMKNVINCKHDDLLDDRFFSEIYMLDYVSKNLELKDYVGFCHYRKYFSFKDNIPNLSKLFANAEVLAAKPIIFKRTIKEQYDACHNIEDLLIVEKIIKEKYSDYYLTFEKFINGHVIFPYNMFIMKREDFLEYIKFVKGVLDEYVKIVGTDIEGRILSNKDKYIKDFKPNNTIDYQYRIGGYLAERLTNVFIMKNFKKIAISKVVITEKKY